MTLHGKKTYKGKPCAKGHTLRWISTRGCVECLRERGKRSDVRAKKNAQSLAKYHRGEKKRHPVNPEVNRKASREWNQRNVEICRERARRRTSETNFRVMLKHKYGLTYEQYSAMVIAQVCRCFICENPMRSPQVDHCHTIGNIRGLLCRRCNTGLGMFKDNPDIMGAAIRYVTSSAQ